MSQNVINSAYPVVNPIQMQAPVNISYPSNQSFVAPTHPIQTIDLQQILQKSNQVLANYNKGILFRVDKVENGNFHIKLNQPSSYPATEYEITPDGSLLSYNVFQSAPKVLKDNCDLLKNAYYNLEVLNSSNNPKPVVNPRIDIKY